MTEEEMAEEIAKDIYIHHFDDDINYPYVLKAITVGVQKGAEHGYNKAKVEVEDSYRESLCNSELNLASVTQQLEELKKANEWHYPSKNELPNCDDKTLLVFIANDYYERNGEIKKIKRTVLGFYKKAFMNDNMKLFVEKSKGYEAEHLPKAVIAWKEIVLPELEEAEQSLKEIK